MDTRFRQRASGALALFLFFAAALSAQSFRGSITGTVYDATGAAVPAAAINVENKATGLTRSTVASTEGAFSVPELTPGVYTVTATKAGFAAQRAEVTVEVTRSVTVDFRLGVAQQATTVDVAAQAVQIETTSSALVGVVGTKAVEDLPMNGRDFRQMFKLTPGVGVGSSPAVNGMRTSGNNFQIDGADNNDAFHNTSAVNQGGVSGIAGTLLPVEAIDQFSIQTNAGADMGRNAGSAVNIVIKSGTNDLHGSLYYFNRNEALAALSPFAAPGSSKRAIRNNQYGFALGGPIIRNRTFFFLTGEGQQATAANSLLVTVPSNPYVAQARQVLAQYGVPASSVSERLLNFWPARTRNAPATRNNFLSVDNNLYDSYNGIIKVDQVLTSRHQLAMRYFGGTGAQTAVVDNNIPFAEFMQVAPSRMHNVSVVLTSTLTPTVVNQLTLGTNYFLQTFNDADTGYDPLAAGLNTGVAGDPVLRGSPFLRITGFSGVSATQPLGRIDTTGHIVDNVSWAKGNHQLKIGGEYRRAVLDVFYDTDKRGRFTFDGNSGPWRGDASLGSIRALADFMAGYTASQNGAVIVRGNLQRDYRQNSFDWWVHDDWKVSRRLTINAGLRYTYHGVLYDVDKTITNFLPGRGFVVPGRDIGGLYPRDWNNFAPRIGFAYQPFSNGKTVLRGSYGIFYDVPPLNFFVANTSMPNGGSAGVHANPGGPEPVYSIGLNSVNIQPGVDVFGGANPRPPFGVFSVSQDFRTPYVQNYQFNVQQQLSSKSVLQVGYVSSLGRKLSLIRNLNPTRFGTAADPQTLRLLFNQYPTLGAINELNSIGTSYYHSLQTQFRQSLTKGLTFTANYTWGRTMDYGSNVRNALPANSFDLRREKGPANFDVRHMFTSFVSYDLPRFTNKLTALTGGWQVNTLMTFHTGQPIDILEGTNVSGSRDGRDRANVIGDPFANIPAAPGIGQRYLFNPAAFAAPAPGTFGNIGRNAIYGPGFGSVDFSVFKNIPLYKERVRAQFRVEVFNLFNRTNYANPAATRTATTNFGLLSQTLNGASAPGIGFGEPRNTQLALKIQF